MALRIVCSRLKSIWWQWQAESVEILRGALRYKWVIYYQQCTFRKQGRGEGGGQDENLHTPTLRRVAPKNIELQTSRGIKPLQQKASDKLALLRYELTGENKCAKIFLRHICIFFANSDLKVGIVRYYTWRTKSRAIIWNILRIWSLFKGTDRPDFIGPRVALLDTLRLELS